MTIQHRSTSSVAATANSSTSMVLPVPSPAPVANDLLVVMFACPGTAQPTVTPPTGWTLVGNSGVYKAGSPGVQTQLYTKRATGSETAETWTWSSTNGPIATQHVYYSDTTGALVSVEQAANATTTTSSTTRTTAPLTVGGARKLVEYHADASNSTWTGVTGTVRRTQIRSSSLSILLADNDVSAAGTYTATATSSAATAVRTDGLAALLEQITDLANAGADQANVEPWSTVTLTGAGNNAGSWSQVSGTAVTLAGSGTTRTFTAPALMDASTLTFRYTVGSASDDMTVGLLPATEAVLVGGVWQPLRVTVGEFADAAPAWLTKSSTGQLQLAGAPVRLAGANIYWLALNDNATGGTGSFVSDADIKLALDQNVSMGGNSARIHTLGISYGKTNTIMPTLGNYNDAALERADFVVAEAGKRGTRLAVPVVDRWDFYHGGLLTLARMVLGSSATLSDGYTNAQVRTALKAYLTYLLNRVNRYNGLRWGADPTLAIWQLGNECYDMPAAFSVDIAAHLKSLAPNALIMDGTGASGMHTANAPGLSDPNVDIVSDHLYDDHRMDSSWVSTDAASAKGANKVFGVDEFDWTDTDNNVTKTRTGGTRAAFLSFLEADPRVSISYYWSLEVAKATVGTHRDGYELYADAPENSEQAAGRAALKVHAQNMIANPNPTAPTSPADTTVNGVSDAFTGTNGAAPDTSKWTVYATTGSSSTIQSNAMQLVTGTSGGYADKVATVSKASPRANQRVTLDFTATTARAGFFQVPIRSAAQDSSIGDVACYRVEVNLTDGSTSLVRRGTNAVVLGSGFTIPGWAVGTTAHLEFAAIGTSITVTAWTGSTKPSTPQIAVTSSDVTAAGYNGIVLNGGSALQAVTVNVDNYALANA